MKKVLLVVLVLVVSFGQVGCFWTGSDIDLDVIESCFKCADGLQPKQEPVSTKVVLELMNDIQSK